MNKTNLNRHINVRVPERIYDECLKIAESYSMSISTLSRVLLISAVDTFRREGDLPKTKQETPKKKGR